MSGHPLAPYDACVVLSFGGPEGPDEVLPFLRRVTAGRGIPDERLIEVGAHYALFGGVSPINAQNRALVAALASEFAGRGVDIPVVLANRNTPPFVEDVLAELSPGCILVLLTSAYRSYSSCRQYREDLARAAHGHDLLIDKIEASLRQLGGSLENIVRTRIYVRNIDDWEAAARVHGERFATIRPANTLVKAELVGEEYLVEMEAEAIL